MSKVQANETKSPDSLKGRMQNALVQGVRLTFLMLILGITLLFQSSQPEFTTLDVLYPVYMLLAASFALNAIYLIWFERATRTQWPTAGLFAFDTVFVTAIIYYTGISQSIFLFFYLTNIILCGFIFLRRGALALSLWTAVLYSFLVIVGNDTRSETFYLAFILNLLAFFAVAFLSGFLSEQLNFTGRELRARRRDLADLTDLNNLIIENVATGLITVTAEGRIVRANRSAMAMLDRQETLLDLNINEIFADFMAKVGSVLSAQESGERAQFDVEYRNARNEKLIIEMLVSALQRTEEAEKTTLQDGYVLIFQDLTKVRRLEFAMRQSEKLAAVGQLAAGIAHEIRNPLASISGSIQLLRSMLNNSSTSEEGRLMTIVLREIDRLNLLISEFLDFVRPDSQELVAIQANDILKEVCDMAKVNSALRADVVQNVDLKSLQMIAGQFDKLKQAFLNMVINAYQAMDKSEVAQLTISSYDRGKSVVIKIRDTGSGIDPINLRRMFEPFHTTKPKGTGLGLAMTHKILENHGARVFVDSTVGVGTEFTLEFPALVEHREIAPQLKKSQ